MAIDGAITSLLILAAILLYCLYKFFKKNNNFWESQGVCVVKKHPILGSFNVMLLKQCHMEDMENYKKLGRIYGRYDGQTPILVIGDPEILKKVLVKDFNVFPNRRPIQFGDPVIDNSVGMLEGSDWKRVRSVLTSLSTGSKLRKILYLVEDCSDSTIERLSKVAKSGESVDMKPLFGKYVIDIIASCAFGIKIDAEDNTNPFIINANKLLQSFFSWRSFMTVMFPQIMKIFKISLFNPESTKFFQKFVLNAINKRKNSGKVRFDFLQMLMETEMTENNNGHVANGKVSQAKNMNLDEIVSQCCGFFIAGYHSTSFTLSNLFYNLALYPEYQDRMREEINNILENTNSIDYEKLNEMKYVEAAILETLRMYPALVRPEREAADDYKIDKLNINIKKGMLISVAVCGMHYDPEWYPEPEKFNPERFVNTETASAYTSSCIYLPFGTGPRSCVGMRFALMIMKLCIAKILKNFQFRLAPECEYPPQLDSKDALLKIKNVILKFEFHQ
ncbi:cytochrome P450 3A8-like isoform X1 [Centruroides sculpturatus]|uniref:cytochrome P450 3A8-like isoform X1 n=2 Tax=Centruroides sculpturatus TaxID=218467 RepID=UPI000C6C9B3E|nr:cytochrome P450 3A8-like isoform X1 [Centruroides sculpturatus]